MEVLQSTNKPRKWMMSHLGKQIFDYWGSFTYKIGNVIIEAASMFYRSVKEFSMKSVFSHFFRSLKKYLTTFHQKNLFCVNVPSHKNKCFKLIINGRLIRYKLCSISPLNYGSFISCLFNYPFSMTNNNKKCVSWNLFFIHKKNRC